MPEVWVCLRRSSICCRSPCSFSAISRLRSRMAALLFLLAAQLLVDCLQHPAVHADEPVVCPGFHLVAHAIRQADDELVRCSRIACAHGYSPLVVMVGRCRALLLEDPALEGAGLGFVVGVQTRVGIGADDAVHCPVRLDELVPTT